MTSCNTLPEPRSPRINYRERQKVVVLKDILQKGLLPKEGRSFSLIWHELMRVLGNDTSYGYK
jgi:hypothetical protein